MRNVRVGRVPQADRPNGKGSGLDDKMEVEFKEKWIMGPVSRARCRDPAYAARGGGRSDTPAAPGAWGQGWGLVGGGVSVRHIQQRFSRVSMAAS